MTNQFDLEPEDQELDESEGFVPEVSDDTDSDQPQENDGSDESDPLAEIRSQIESFKPLTELNPAQIKSALGRVSSLQSAIDRLQSKDPAADIAPKLTQIEEFLDLLADAVLGSDFTPDDSKQRIQNSRTARIAERERQKIINEIRGEVTPKPADNPYGMSPEEVVLWTAASQDVVAIAQEKGFDARTIPDEVWDAGRATGSVTKAVRYVEAWIDKQINKDEKPVERVAERKVAAGKGSPQRSGGAALTDEELWDDYGMNPQNYKTADAVKKVREAGKRLGYVSS